MLFYSDVKSNGVEQWVMSSVRIQNSDCHQIRTRSGEIKNSSLMSSRATILTESKRIDAGLGGLGISIK
jgi:hypothetical protein